jgi:hypothetical protein
MGKDGKHEQPVVVVVVASLPDNWGRTMQI